MEYCADNFEIERNKRRFARAVYKTLAAVCILGAACEMPSMDGEEIAAVNESAVEENDRMREGNIFSELSVSSLGAIKLPRRSLNESLEKLKQEGHKTSALLMPPSPGRYTEWVDSLFDSYTGTEITAEIPEEGGIAGSGISQAVIDMTENGGMSGTVGQDMPPVTPEHSTGPNHSIVPSVPDQPVAPDTPDVPNHPVIPDIPDVPDYPDISDTPDNPDIPDGSVVPEEPDIPDTPNEPTVPDSPSEEGDAVPSPPGVLINEEGMIYGFSSVEEVLIDGYLELPAEGCVGILSSAFAGIESEIMEIHVPTNITYIEEGAFSGMPNLFGIWVDEGNPSYSCMEGVLFDKGVTTLLAFPAGRIGVYNMPGSVTRLADYSLMNTGLGKLEMRACGPIEIGSAVFGGGSGNGLVIFAPSDYLTQYEEAFAGFDVVIRK